MQAHGQFSVRQDTWVFFCQAAFQLVLTHGIVPPHMHDFAFSPHELHEAAVCPFLHPVGVVLYGIISIPTTPPISVSSPNVLSVHYASLSRSLTKMLYHIGLTVLTLGYYTND